MRAPSSGWLYSPRSRTGGVEDVCILVCDGLKGCPTRVSATWPLTTVQTCLLHLIRNTFRYASRKDWDALGKQLRPVYTAPSAAAAAERFDEFAGTWGSRYPAVIRLWRNAWEEFIGVPGLRRGDPPSDLLDQRHREPGRPVSAGDPGPRPLLNRAGRAQVPLPGHPSARPHGSRSGHAGPFAGSPPSTPLSSPSNAASSHPQPTNQDQLHRRSDSPRRRAGKGLLVREPLGVVAGGK